MAGCRLPSSGQDFCGVSGCRRCVDVVVVAKVALALRVRRFGWRILYESCFLPMLCRGRYREFAVEGKNHFRTFSFPSALAARVEKVGGTPAVG